MIYGDLEAASHQCGDAGVCVTENHHRIRLLCEEDALGSSHHISKNGTQGAGISIEEVVRPAEAQIFEENLIELIVVVLPSVNEYVVRVLLKGSDDPRKANDLRSRSYDGHDP